MKINLIPRVIQDFVEYHKRSTEQILKKLNQLTYDTVGGLDTIVIIASHTEEMSGASKYLSFISGARIIVITRPEQLRGLHIDGYIISLCVQDNPLYGQIMSIVRTRLKN